MSSIPRKILVGVVALTTSLLCAILWQSVTFESRLNTRSPASTHKAEATEGKESREGGKGGTGAATGDTMYGLDELVANVRSSEGMHSLQLRVEIELFKSEGRSLLDSHRAAIRNTILESIYEQDYRTLGTLAGKLYFKELLVTRLNEFLSTPQVRDIHFSNFLLN